jgi:hypothetical protein
LDCSYGIVKPEEWHAGLDEKICQPPFQFVWSHLQVKGEAVARLWPFNAVEDDSSRETFWYLPNDPPKQRSQEMAWKGLKRAFPTRKISKRHSPERLAQIAGTGREDQPRSRAEAFRSQKITPPNIGHLGGFLGKIFPYRTDFVTASLQARVSKHRRLPARRQGSPQWRGCIRCHGAEMRHCGSYCLLPEKKDAPGITGRYRSNNQRGQQVVRRRRSEGERASGVYLPPQQEDAPVLAAISARREAWQTPLGSEMVQRAFGVSVYPCAN